MQAAIWLIFGAGCIVLISAVAAKSRRPLFAVLGSALLGAGGLAAVNLLSPYTGIALGLNWVTGFVAAVLSLPGIITLLLLRLFLHI